MKKSKVILFNPPLNFVQGLPSAIDVSVPPLGILYLASYINFYSSEFKALVVDVAAERLSLKEIYAEVKKEKPFAVGISSMTPQLQGAVELAKFLKEKLGGKTKIFLGGPHVSADPGFLFRFPGLFDYGITGEAEKTFLESLIKLSEGRRIPKIQKGEPLADLDQIPFPDRSLIKREKYRQEESMMFSRGCPYHCYYCSRPAIDKKIRYRSVQNLIEEIKSVYRTGKGKIDFQDDSFTLDQKKVQEFCREILREGLKLSWTCNTRIDLVDEKLLKEMGKAGCRLIHFGIESGNEAVRKKIVNKGSFSNKQIEKTFVWCHKYRIKVGGYFMIGHPGEGRKDLKDTKTMILNSKIDLLGVSVPTPFPGSKLYQIAKEKGFISEGLIDKFAKKELGEGYAGNYPVFVPDGFTREEIYSEMKEINRHFYLNFRTFWKKFREDFVSFRKIKNDFQDLVSLVLRGVSSRKPYITDHD